MAWVRPLLARLGFGSGPDEDPDAREGRPTEAEGDAGDKVDDWGADSFPASDPPPGP